MNDDMDFNKILQRQKIVPPRTNLSARIIAAAHQKPAIPLWAIILEEISAMFILPRPAYAVALTLILGVVLGLQGEVTSTMNTEDWLSFMDVSGYITEENWL